MISGGYYRRKTLFFMPFPDGRYRPYFPQIFLSGTQFKLTVFQMFKNTEMEVEEFYCPRWKKEADF